MLDKFLQSSVNPVELSMRVRGALMTIVPIAGLVLKSVGSEVSEDNLKQAVELIGDIVIAAGSLVSAGMMLWGTVRSWFAKKPQ